uniref:Uncharacterized protein n=1 Tax=Anguilla anguilla TaxID=7936 RepID=A0A0E9QDP4_ANGAN
MEIGFNEHTVNEGCSLNVSLHQRWIYKVAGLAYPIATPPSTP